MPSKSKTSKLLIKKLESPILYTSNCVLNLEEANSQLLACFIIFLILHCDILQTRPRIKALTSLASYIQNRPKASRDYIMNIPSITSSTPSRYQISYPKLQSIIASMIFDLSYLALPYCEYHYSCLKTWLRTKIRRTFPPFLLCITTNEHRMHAQESAEENALSPYEMTRYPRISHALIILSLRSKSGLPSRIDL